MEAKDGARDASGRRKDGARQSRVGAQRMHRALEQRTADLERPRAGRDEERDCLGGGAPSERCDEHERGWRGCFVAQQATERFGSLLLLLQLHSAISVVGVVTTASAHGLQEAAHGASDNVPVDAALRGANEARGTTATTSSSRGNSGGGFGTYREDG